MAGCEQFRADFPALRQKVHGKPLVFLDSAASSLKPRAVVDRIAHYYAFEHSNVHRGAYQLSQVATDHFEQSRRTVARYVNAAHEHEIIFTRGTTESINLVADTFGAIQVSAGDEILVTGLEHHSNMVPWQMLCQRRGATLKIIPVDKRGELELDLDTQLTPRTKLVAVTHVSNSLGTVVPLEDIVAAAHAEGIPVLVDGAQGAPHCPIDVQALDCDFYCFSGHKVYGPTGIGVVYGKEALLDAAPPWQGGGDMIQMVTYEGFTHDTLPHKFEAGTPHIAGVIGLAAALEYVEGVGIEAIQRHEADLLAYAHRRLEAMDGVRLVGTARHKAGVISFVVDGAHHLDIGRLLDEHGVAVRVGHHCTMPLMMRLNLPGTVRASLGLYNTHDDIDALVEGIQRAQTKLSAIKARPHDMPACAGTFEERQHALLEDFALFETADEKREYLMELGDSLPRYNDMFRTEDYRIHGCQSMVWLRTACEGNLLQFIADSDALITKGMIALLVHLLTGLTPQAVYDMDLDALVHRVGLPSLVTARRKNGLAAMTARIKRDALKHGAHHHQ